MNSENFGYFECDNIGVTMENIKIKEVHSNGQHYWKATQPIETLFGMEVEGEISAIGPTREKCLENLKQQQKKLADSLWI